MSYKVIWQDIKSAPDRKILMWREDTKDMIYDFPKKDYINHPEYAYTLWTEAPETPKVDRYNDIPCDTEPNLND